VRGVSEGKKRGDVERETQKKNTIVEMHRNTKLATGVPTQRVAKH
jgi:hypothetical protein